MKKCVSLNLEAGVYQEAKRTVPERQISLLVNNLLKEYLKKQKEEKLKEAYQRTAKSKKMRMEDKV
jgi:hypothetical protein